MVSPLFLYYVLRSLILLSTNSLLLFSFFKIWDFFLLHCETESCEKNSAKENTTWITVIFLQSSLFLWNLVEGTSLFFLCSGRRLSNKYLKWDSWMLYVLYFVLRFYIFLSTNSLFLFLIFYKVWDFFSPAFWNRMWWVSKFGKRKYNVSYCHLSLIIILRKKSSWGDKSLFYLCSGPSPSKKQRIIKMQFLNGKSSILSFVLIFFFLLIHYFFYLIF